MTAGNAFGSVVAIPVDQIDVLNPRERNNRIFAEIVANIKAIGLKKPVVVTRRPGAAEDGRYLLVCGEGRLKAFKALGEASIPALIIQASEEDAFIMSLAENIARRQSLWRVNLDERRATIWMRTVSRRLDHARHLFVVRMAYSAGWLSLGLGTPTFLGVAKLAGRPAPTCLRSIAVRRR